MKLPWCNFKKRPRTTVWNQDQDRDHIFSFATDLKTVVLRPNPWLLHLLYLEYDEPVRARNFWRKNERKTNKRKEKNTVAQRFGWWEGLCFSEEGGWGQISVESKTVEMVVTDLLSAENQRRRRRRRRMRATVPGFLIPACNSRTDWRQGNNMKQSDSGLHCQSLDGQSLGKCASL